MKVKLVCALGIIVVILLVGIYFMVKVNSVTKIPNYKLISKIAGDLPRSQIFVYEHIKTGAIAVYYNNPNDDDNLFTVGFKTIPFDSSGVFHIIEHSILEGSDKYPIPQLFDELRQSYITTFINALTYPDKTLYPVSSNNPESFKNLSNVYIDVVFNPLVKHDPRAFYQEGIRKQIEKDGSLTNNGIVYNEMFATINSSSVFFNQFKRQLLPGSGYSYISGGDPEEIATLTYDRFLDAFNKFYHPSNSLIFFYGDLDIKERLSYIDENYLSKYDKTDSFKIEVSTLPPVEAGKNPEPIIDYYPASPAEDISKDSQVAFGYVTDDLSLEETLALETVLSAVFNSESSSYRKELISSGLFKDIDADTYQTRSLLFYIKAIGTDPKNVDKIYELINSTLKQIVTDGLSKDLIKSIITKNLFNLKNIPSGNLGLSRYAGLIYSGWMYKDDPLSMIGVTKALETLLKKVEDPSYFTQIISKCILDNQKRYTGIISPKESYLKEKQARIGARLKEEKKNLTEEDIKKIEDINKLLKDNISTGTDTSKYLPVLKLEDISTASYKFDLLAQKEKINLASNTKTNLTTDLLTFDSKYDDIEHIGLMYGLSHLNESDFIDLSMFNSLLRRVATRNRSFEELNQKFNYLGSFDTGISDIGTREGKSIPYFYLGFDTEASNVSDIFDLGLETVYESLFEDKTKIEQVLKEDMFYTQRSMSSSPINYIVGAGASFLSPQSYINEYVSGFKYIRELSNTEKTIGIEKDFEAFKERMVAIQKKVFEGNLPVVTIISKTKEGTDKIKASVEKSRLAELLNISDSSIIKSNFELLSKVESGMHNIGFIIPQNVSYVAKLMDLSKVEGFKYGGEYQVIEEFLTQNYLTNEIRKKGGAYGSSISIGRSGMTRFLSWRDQGVASTNKVYEGTPEYMRQVSESISSLDELKAKISSISSVDYPVSPKANGGRAFSRTLGGFSEQDIKGFRDEIIKTDLSSVLKEKADIIEKGLKGSVVSVGAGETLISKDKNLFKEVKAITDTK